MASLLDRAVVGVLPLIPKPIVGHFSRHYIAGETIGDAFRVVSELKDLGAGSTLDILGENIRLPEEADRAQEGYLKLLEEIRAQAIHAGVSVKLTQLGLKLDPDACFRRIEALVARAQELGIFVRLDMEDSTCTDSTLKFHEDLRGRFTRVGVVIQSMLRRSRTDVEQLASVGANVRLCKGIYVEPQGVAYQDREEIRESFVRLLEILLAGGCYVGIATHDEFLISEARRLVAAYRLDREAYEFQMLLGVAEPLRRQIIAEGHRLRVYVPFGHQWYAYSVRRLKENPTLAGTIARAALRRG